MVKNITLNEEDILGVYKEEGKLQEYKYCKDHLRFLQRDKNKTIKDISGEYCVGYNSLLRWKRKARIPYGVKCLNFLKQKLLLPYCPTERTARIVGVLHGDGYLLQSLLSFGFVSKDKETLFNIEKDVLNEFKLNGKIKKKRDVGDKEIINGKEIIVKQPTYELQYNSKAVSSLLFRLGVPRGKKIYQKINVPNWIVNGNSYFQRAFLQGLFDSELSNSRISTFKGHKDNLSQPRMEMGKEESLKDNLLDYLKQIKNLLNNFGINSKISSLREYKKGKVSSTLSINNKISNIYYFIERVGFYYNLKRANETIEIKNLALQKIKNMYSNQEIILKNLLSMEQR